MISWGPRSISLSRSNVFSPYVLTRRELIKTYHIDATRQPPITHPEHKVRFVVIIYELEHVLRITADIAICANRCSALQTCDVWQINQIQTWPR